jgi:hypothetical protein
MRRPVAPPGREVAPIWQPEEPAPVAAQEVASNSRVPVADEMFRLAVQRRSQAASVLLVVWPREPEELAPA